MSNKTQDNTEIINLLGAVTEAANTGLTRGEVQTVLVAGRFSDTAIAFTLVAVVLDPNCKLNPDVRMTNAMAVVKVAQEADIETIRKLLV